MPDLTGQIALVTGASTGIGRHLAEGLAARGMAVAGLARTADRLTTAMDEVAAATGARTLAVAADVTDRAAVDAAVARVHAELGRVDLLVNNAGLMDVDEVPVWEADPDEWWAVVESHVRGGAAHGARRRPRDGGPRLGPRGLAGQRPVHPRRGHLLRLLGGQDRAHAAHREPRRGAGGHRGPGVRPRARRGGDDDVAVDVHPRGPHRAGRPPRSSWSCWPPSPAASSTSGRAASCAPVADDLDALRRTTPGPTGRQLRLVPYGTDDPTAAV